MKRLLLSIVFLSALVNTFAQSGVTLPALQAKRITATEMLVLRSQKIDSLSSDTSLAGNRNDVVSYQRAIKAYVDKRANRDRPVFGTRGLEAINDSTLGIAGYEAYSGVNKYLGWSEQNSTWGMHAFPFTGGGSGDTTRDVIRLTLMQLDIGMNLDTNKVYFASDKRKQGFFVYGGTAANQTPDNGGTVIVDQNLKIWNRIYNGELEGAWFDIVDDVVYTPGDDYAHGTNSSIGLQKAINAAYSGQKINVRGNVFLPDVIDTNVNRDKRLLIEFFDNTYQAGNDLFILTNYSGPFEQHKIIHHGLARDRMNMPTHSKATYDANTDPDWASLTGTFVKIYNTSQCKVIMNFAEGFKTPVQILVDGRITGLYGTQENRIEAMKFSRNAMAASVVILKGTGYADKNKWFVERMSGDVIYHVDGVGDWVTGNGVTYSGSVTSNEIHGLIEQANVGIKTTGNNTSPLFNVVWENGPVTGLFSDTMAYCEIGGPSGKGRMISPTYGGGGLWDVKHIRPPNQLGTHAQIDKKIFDESRLLTRQAWTGADGAIVTAIPVGRSLTRLEREAAISRAPNLRFTNDVGYEAEVTTTSRFYNVPVDTLRILNYDYNTAANGTIFFPSAATSVKRDVTVYNNSPFAVAISAVQGFTSLPAGAIITFYSNGFTWRAKETLTTSTSSGGGISKVALTVGAGNASGAEIVLDSIRLHAATTTTPGIVTAGEQSFSGYKSFVGSFTTAPGGVVRGFRIAPTLVSPQNNTTMYGLEVDPVFSDGGFTGNIKYAIGAPNFAFKGTGLRTSSINATANGLAWNETATPNPGAAATLYAWNVGSGSSSRDILALFSKTGVMSAGFGNDGTDLFFVTGGTNNGYKWVKNIGFSTATLQTGTELMRLTPAGNLMIGGTTNNGDALQVTGRGSVTDQFYVGQLSADPSTNLRNGAMYYNTTLDKMRIYQAGTWSDMQDGGGGGTGGGVTSFGAVGAGNANGGSISGSVATLHAATSTQPGIISIGTQTLSGLKTFSQTLTLRASTAAAGTTSLSIPAGTIPTVPENNKLVATTTHIWVGFGNQWQSVTTNSNLQTLTNKVWDGANISVHKIDGFTSINNAVLRTTGASNGTYWGEDYGGEILASDVTSTTTLSELIDLDEYIPFNSAGEIEITLVGENTSTPGQIYSRHMVQPYYKGATHASYVSKGGSPGVVNFYTDFTVVGAGPVSSSGLTIQVNSPANGVTIEWTVYVRVRQTRNTQ